MTYTSNDTIVASVSGSTLTINGLGTVTITAPSLVVPIQSNSNITYLAAEECQSYLHRIQGRPVYHLSMLCLIVTTLPARPSPSPPPQAPVVRLPLKVTTPPSLALSGDNQTATILGEGPVTITASQAGTSHLQTCQQVTFLQPDQGQPVHHLWCDGGLPIPVYPSISLTGAPHPPDWR